MFAKYVSLKTCLRAGFNYWEPSFNINDNQDDFIVYHTKYPVEPRPNLVIIESYNNPKEIYFGYFFGKHSGECKTMEETEDFFKKIREFINPKFKTKGNNLEKEIIKIINGVDEKLLKQF